jgi:hypothetical protein
LYPFYCFLLLYFYGQEFKHYIQQDWTYLTRHWKLLRRQRSGGSQFKTSPSKQFKRPYSKKNASQKRAGGVAQGVGPESKTSTTKKKKKDILAIF